MLSKVGIFGNAAIDHHVSAHTVCRKEDRVDIICGRTQRARAWTHFSPMFYQSLRNAGVTIVSKSNISHRKCLR